MIAQNATEGWLFTFFHQWVAQYVSLRNMTQYVWSTTLRFVKWTETVASRCSSKWMFLKISHILQENTFFHRTPTVAASEYVFLKKLAGLSPNPWSLLKNWVDLLLLFSNLSLFKVGLSPSKKILFVCFSESPLKMMENAFCFISKALFLLSIFKCLSWLFGHIEKTA